MRLARRALLRAGLCGQPGGHRMAPGRLLDSYYIMGAVANSTKYNVNVRMLSKSTNAR